MNIYYTLLKTIKDETFELPCKILDDDIILLEVQKNNPYYIYFKTKFFGYSKLNLLNYFRCTTVIHRKEPLDNDVPIYKYDNVDLNEILGDIKSMRSSNQNPRNKSRKNFYYIYKIENVGYMVSVIDVPIPYTNDSIFEKEFTRYFEFIENNKNKPNITLEYKSLIAENLGYILSLAGAFSSNNMSLDGDVCILAYLFRAYKAVKNLSFVKDVKVYTTLHTPRGLGYYPSVKNKMYDVLKSTKECQLDYIEHDEFDLAKDIKYILKQLNLMEGYRTGPFSTKFNYIFDIICNNKTTKNKDKHYFIKVKFNIYSEGNYEIRRIPIYNTQSLLELHPNYLRDEKSEDINKIYKERNKEIAMFISENLKSIFAKYAPEEDLRELKLIDEYHYRFKHRMKLTNVFNWVEDRNLDSYPKFIFNFKQTNNTVLFNFDFTNVKSSKYDIYLSLEKDLYNRNINIIKDVIKFISSKKFKNTLKKITKKYPIKQSLSTYAKDINHIFKEKSKSFEEFVVYATYKYLD